MEKTKIKKTVGYVGLGLMAIGGISLFYMKSNPTPSGTYDTERNKNISIAMGAFFTGMALASISQLK